MSHDDNAHMMSDEHDPAASTSSPLTSPFSSPLSHSSDSDMESPTTVSSVSPTTAVSSVSAPLRRTASPASGVALSKALPRPASSSSIHQSAKMATAQLYFQRVVKQELHVLLTSGVERDVAVKRLLHRIVASTDAPAPHDVRRVMKQFDMHYDDAVRALIVKQEIGRLKRQGMDAFAAIEELTRKMQRTSGLNQRLATPVAPTVVAAIADTTHPVLVKRVDGTDTADGGDACADPPVDDDDDAAIATSAPQPEQQIDCNHHDNNDAPTALPAAIVCNNNDSDDVRHANVRNAATESVAATDDVDDTAIDATAALPTSPLSLCQRIGNVTISTSSRSLASSDATGVVAAASDDDDASINPVNSVAFVSGLASPQSSASRSIASSSASSSSPALVSRKRRGAFGPFGIVDMKDSATTDHRPSHNHHRNSHSHRSNHSRRTNLTHSRSSSLPMFSSSKKQKLMTDDDDNDDGIPNAMTSTQQPRTTRSPPASPPPVRLSSPSTPSTAVTSPAKRSRWTNAHSNLHKRPREAASLSLDDDESPVVHDDDDDVLSAHVMRRTKRHRHTHQQHVAATAATNNDTSSNSLH